MSDSFFLHFFHAEICFVYCFLLHLLDGFVFKTNVELSEQSGDPVPSTLPPLFFCSDTSLFARLPFCLFCSCFVDTAFVDSPTWSSFAYDTVVGIRVVAACGFTNASSESCSLHKKNLAEACCVDGSFPLERRL